MSPFFFLPFALFGGIALQHSGLLLLAMILPLALHLRQGQPAPRLSAASTAQLASAFLVAYLVFSVCSAWGVWWGDASVAVPPSRLFYSRFSSALLFSGLTLFALAWAMGRRSASSTASIDSPPPVAFHKGLATASVVWLIYILIQQFTGFEPRAEGHILAEEHQISEHLWRVYGLYGHPLTLGSVGAALGIYGLVRLFRGEIPRLEGALISGAGTWAVVASGGRMPLLSFLCTFVLVVVLHFRLITRKAWWALGFGTLLCMGFLASGAFLARFSRIHDAAHVEGDHRLDFWKVHWEIFKSHPWTGAGAGWLEAGGRELWYQTLGLGELSERFNAHSMPLEILASGGVLAVVALLWAIWRVGKALKASQALPPFAALGFALLPNLLHGLTQNVFFDASVQVFYLGLFWASYWVEGRLPKAPEV